MCQPIFDIENEPVEPRTELRPAVQHPAQPAIPFLPFLVWYGQSPFDNCCAPCQSCTEPDQHQIVAVAHAPGLDGFAQGNRHRGRRCVAVMLQILENLAFIQFQVFCRRFDDAGICLMGDEQINIAQIDVCFFARFFGGTTHHPCGEFIHFGSIHFYEMVAVFHRFYRGGIFAAAAGHHQIIAAAAIRPQHGRQHAARLFAGLQNHRPRAITEQHTGGAVFPIGNAG